MSATEMLSWTQDGNRTRDSLENLDLMGYLKERHTLTKKISIKPRDSTYISSEISKEKLTDKRKKMSPRQLSKAIGLHIKKIEKGFIASISQGDYGNQDSETVSKVVSQYDESDSESIGNTSEINFRVSDTEVLRSSTFRSIKRTILTGIFRKGYIMPLWEFEQVAKDLYKCCLKSVTDLHELHLRRMRALDIIKHIIQSANSEYISTAHIIHIIWSIMSCLHHFQLRLKSGSNKLVMYNRQRLLDKCMEYYFLLIHMFKSNTHSIILSAIITFYMDGKLWDIEFACTDMIAALLEISEDVEPGVIDLLDHAVHIVSENVLEAQKLMEVIYEVLRTLTWKKISKNLIDKMIYMLESSISTTELMNSVYGPLRMGLDLCVRHVINNISNNDVMVMLKQLLQKMVQTDSEETVLNFGNLASYAAKRYKMRSLYENITPDLLLNISLLTRNQDEMTFLTAARIWLNLINRNKNGAIINQPRIFFWDSDYKIKIKRKRKSRDKIFFKAYREYFYELITDCFKQSVSRVQMNAIFEMCALCLIEIPCGYTAATFTAVAMSMQEYARKITNEDIVKSHYLHATALSILTLICYIHKAEVLYDYIINITDLRAEWAPHLIPPLKSKYEYAVHHVLWNKAELFFEDWETGYGLWKCFRDKNGKKT